MTHASSSSSPSGRIRRRDDGAALALVIVIVVGIAASIAAIANYASTNLRYAGVTENRSDRLAAADAGMRYAIDQLKLRNAGCVLDDKPAVLPRVDADFNDATATVECLRISNGFDGIQAWAAVMTGEGLDPSDSLLSSQSGSNEKILGGPVYMSRVDPDAFDIGPPVKIENGPLIYHDTTGNVPCTSIPSSSLPMFLEFEPELIFGPECVSVGWDEVFLSPEIPDLTTLPVRSGDVDLASAAGAAGTEADPLGSYTDVGGCRVFEPGRYITMPDTRGVDAYFLTGEYVLEENAQWEIRQGLVTAGRLNPITTPTLVPEKPPSAACQAQQDADPAPADQYGATFYLAGGARINVATNGSIEIHARQQGDHFVTIQTLCDPNGTWCRASGLGGFDASKASSITAPASNTSQNIIFTDSGNKKEFVAHALVYAPLGQMEFGNVSNTATQRMLGGLIVSRLVLQSATSATNFEISVPTSPITAQIRLTSTGVKNGETSVRAVVEYRPYEESIDDRIRVNSWRVCAAADCGDAIAPTTCAGSDAVWVAEVWNNASFLGDSDLTYTTPTIAEDWDFGSPGAVIDDSTFSIRFTRTVDLPSAGTYRFTIASDDGYRLFVDGAQVAEDWTVRGVETHTVDVVVTEPCGVDLMLEYFENTGVAEVALSYTSI